MNMQKNTDCRLSQSDSSDSTLHKNIISTHSTQHVHTEIQTTCIMLFLENTLSLDDGKQTAYYDLTSSGRLTPKLVGNGRMVLVTLPLSLFKG